MRRAPPPSPGLGEPKMAFQDTFSAEDAVLEHFFGERPLESVQSDQRTMEHLCRPIYSEDMAMILERLIRENPEKFQQAKEQPTKAGWFVGHMMKMTNGKGNPLFGHSYMAEKLKGV
jgi:Asp-tRNA(Asn)/Glu-tRNA(Gln) amidotransferase B subunit